jgi:nucleoid DNA-binding protein
MNKAAFVERATRSLEADHDVECALGRFTTRVYPAYVGRNPRTGEGVPVPAKRMPLFTPSEPLLVAAFGDHRVPIADFLRAGPAPGAVHIYHLSAPLDGGEDDLEYGDAEPGIAPPARPIDTVDIGPLFDEAAAALRSGKKFKMSGFGNLGGRRLTKRRLDLPSELRRADDHLTGKQIAFFEFSPVLKIVLNRPV